MHGPPYLHFRFHEFTLKSGKYCNHFHDLIAVGKLQGQSLWIGVQQRLGTGRFVMVVRIALRVDQKLIGCTMLCIPRMVRLNRFISAISQIFSGQAIMFQVTYKLEMKKAIKA